MRSRKASMVKLSLPLWVYLLPVYAKTIMENSPSGPTAAAPELPITIEKIDTGTTEISSDFIAAHAQSPLVPPTGGDFHATFSLNEDPDKVAFVLGDVSGHGPVAGKHAERLKAAIVGCLEEGLTPSDALGYVNAAAEMDPDFPGFATVIAGTIETKTGEVVYASGGHEPAMIAEPSAPASLTPEDAVQELSSTGPPVGAFAAEEVHYPDNKSTLAPGATLLLYSDGVTEARRGKTFVGVDRLRDWLLRFLALPPSRLVRKIFGSALAFVGGKKFRDDVALLVLRRRKRTH
jgi:sigma-B regulation protein RsbU (phosphoserine phosphatase)